MGDEPTERPTHRVALETYDPSPLPDFKPYSAVNQLTADTLDRVIDRTDV
jgi:hypothetical protein